MSIRVAAANRPPISEPLFYTKLCGRGRRIMRAPALPL